jgi:hypothetical protein
MSFSQAFDEEDVVDIPIRGKNWLSYEMIKKMDAGLTSHQAALFKK